ncbi:hypothetical protein SAY86_026607 [Trapa natans]|uniref:Small ribosomal subunit protein uS15c n=1 Tax=Trapa natans TaxID=22666 RepID=A0AAN7KLZ3_TRANT|nr:hypothetical protein SAY86_026607 [Trapa natans]
MALQLRPKFRTLPNPSLVRFLSTSPDSTAAPPEDPPSSSQPSQSQSSISSYLSDIKSKLKQQQHPQQFRRPSSPYSAANQPPPSKVASLEEIRKNLSEFRRRSAAPGPADSPSSQPVSVQELFKRGVIPKGVEPEKEPGPARPVSHLSFDAIRESLKQLRTNTNSRGDKRSGNDGNPLSLSTFKDSLKLKPSEGTSNVIGGTDKLPFSVFGKELREKEKPDSGAGSELKTEFVKVYGHEELGEKLRLLRPGNLAEGKGKFSLEELNERLGKLREMEEKETESRIGGGYRDLRESLLRLRISGDEKSKKTAFQRLDILGHLSQIPEFMLHPPKEHLVEQYFHPDNMSSAEKMKLELAKVREEFKLSESDCGSARVQVAQLTTKIKHLSSVIHKKDKHSRKGLEAMVQRRKKLLKYLRRTDWDSYCLVLSRFGLRDNPDFKH